MIHFTTFSAKCNYLSHPFLTFPILLYSDDTDIPGYQTLSTQNKSLTARLGRYVHRLLSSCSSICSRSSPFRRRYFLFAILFSSPPVLFSICPACPESCFRLFQSPVITFRHFRIHPVSTAAITAVPVSSLSSSRTGFRYMIPICKGRTHQVTPLDSFLILIYHI